MSFVYDDTDLYLDKSNLRAPRNVLVEWTAEDTALIKSALLDIRTALNARDPMALAYGTTGDGVVDDTAELQDAIDNTQGRRLRLTKAKYLVSSTLTINDTATHIVGDYGARNSAGGTEIFYTGLGPCIQIGTDDLLDWSSNLYNGPQDHIFENIAIVHGAPDTSLTSAGPIAGPHYKANAYGIWDWRGGGVVLDHVRMERFEANFVGIQSDINFFQYVQSHYSKYGMYLGPRSDQWIINVLYSFFCDRSVTIDRANGPRICDSHFVGCGTSTSSAIEVRRGSAGVAIERSWFEHLTGSSNGYQGTDQQSFVSVGEVDGYGVGGNITTPGASPTTSSVRGCEIVNPLAYTVVAATAGHTKFVATVGKCESFELRHPTPHISTSLTSLDALVGVQTGNTPSSSDTQIWISGTGLSNSLSKNYTNADAGTPLVRIDGVTSGGSWITWSSSGRIELRSMSGANQSAGAAGADAIQFGQEGAAGAFHVITPQYATGQTTRLKLTRSVQHGAFAAAAPTTLTWEKGDQVLSTDASAGAYAGWRCTTAGTPGTWNEFGLITINANGLLAIPKGFGFTNELVAPQITANQDNYAPSGLGSAYTLLINSSGAFNITGFGSVVSGRELFVYNTGANNITLKHQDAASTATNRIIGRGNADVVLTPATGLTIWYSPTILRWLCKGDSL